MNIKFARPLKIRLKSFANNLKRIASKYCQHLYFWTKKERCVYNVVLLPLGCCAFTAIHQLMHSLIIFTFYCIFQLQKRAMAFLNKLILVSQRTNTKPHQEATIQQLHHERPKSIGLSSETIHNDDAIDLIQFVNPIENHGDGVSRPIILLSSLTMPVENWSASKATYIYCSPYSYINVLSQKLTLIQNCSRLSSGWAYILHDFRFELKVKHRFQL